MMNMIPCFTLELGTLRKLCQTAPSPSVTLLDNQNNREGKGSWPVTTQKKKEKKKPIGLSCGPCEHVP